MPLIFIFFFNDPATTEIYTLSLHDALPISGAVGEGPRTAVFRLRRVVASEARHGGHVGVGFAVTTDRKSTRLNSSHPSISYAVFCLKKKNIQQIATRQFHNFLILTLILQYS